MEGKEDLMILDIIYPIGVRGGGGGGGSCTPYNFSISQSFGPNKNHVIFGQNHLIFGHAIKKKIGRLTSAPINETGPGYAPMLDMSLFYWLINLFI